MVTAMAQAKAMGMGLDSGMGLCSGGVGDYSDHGGGGGGGGISSIPHLTPCGMGMGVWERGGGSKFVWGFGECTEVG